MTHSSPKHECHFSVQGLIYISVTTVLYMIYDYIGLYKEAHCSWVDWEELNTVLSTSVCFP